MVRVLGSARWTRLAVRAAAGALAAAPVALTAVAAVAAPARPVGVAAARPVGVAAAAVPVAAKPSPRATAPAGSSVGSPAGSSAGGATTPAPAPTSATTPAPAPTSASASAAGPASPTTTDAPASASALPAVTGGQKPDLAISGTQTAEGSMRFYVTAHNLPYGTTLTSVPLTVTADGEKLTTLVSPVDGAVPDAGTRGVVVAVDNSAPMSGAPLDAVRDAAAAYAAGLPADVKLGLVTTGGTAAGALQPTTDRTAFDAALNTVAATGGRALYDGLHEADRMLVNDPAFTERRTVLLAGGTDTASAERATDVATELGVDKVKLDVVAYATDGAGGLASGTGGRLVPAADAAALRAASTNLAGAVSPPVLVTVTVPAYLGGRSTRLTVALGDTASTTTPVTFHADSRVPVPLRQATPHELPAWLLVGAMVAVAGGVLVAASVVIYVAMDRSRTRQRLRQLDSFNGASRSTGVRHEEGNAFVRAALAMSDRAVRRRGDQSRIEAALDQAAIDLRAEEWMLLRGVLAVGGAVVGAMLLPWLFGLVVGAAAGWLLPETYRRQRAGRRARKFADLLPEALQLVVSALRSGFSLQQAVDALVREGPDPVAGEFSRALAEIRLGGELEDALDRVAARNGSRDLAWLVMAVRIQREVGGNLSEVMETAVNTMRERARLHRHVRALSAEGRLSAYVLIALPIGVAAFMFVARGEYLRPLYTQFLGLCLLGTAAVLVGVGAFWLSRLIKVKV